MKEEKKESTKSKKVTSSPAKKSASVKAKTSASKSKATSASNATSKKGATTKKTTGAKASDTKKENGIKASTKKSTTNLSTKKPSAKRSTKKATTTKSSTEIKKSTPKKIVAKNTSKKKTEAFEEKRVITQTVPEEVNITFEKKAEVKKDDQIKKEIPFLNYIVAVIAIIWIVIIAFLGVKMNEKHQEKLYDEGYFNHNIDKLSIKKSSINLIGEEIEQSSLENIFVLFNYRGEEEHYRLEKDLEKVMKDYHLENNFYYVDITDYSGILNCDVTCMINQEMNTNYVTNLPAVVYIKNKEVIDVAQREDQKILEAADFVKLLDMYEFKK